jgi:signal transduction histidine kinase
MKARVDDTSVWHDRPTRVSGVTALAAAVLVLLPALAWLQYSWLEQIAEADRDRRSRTLQTAASQLAQDLDREVGRAVLELQLEPSTVEQGTWSDYATRYQLWADSAVAPEIVKSIYFIETPEQRPSQDVPLRVWNRETRVFEPTPWPAELAPLRARFTHESRAIFSFQIPSPKREDRTERGRGGQRLVLPPTPAGDEQSIVVPVMRVTSSPGERIPPPAPVVKLLGFTIIRLDIEAMGRGLIPSLVRRHLFDPDGHSDFLVAVVARDDATRVLYESEPGAAPTADSSPDVGIALLGPRLGPLWFATRDGKRTTGIDLYRDLERIPPPPPPPPGPAEEKRVVVDVIEARGGGANTTQRRTMTSTGEGHWRLIAKHRSGSLEAAVARARTRNFLLSSGILLLLTTAIGLIVVSARRADRLARQQLEFVAAVSHELRTPVSVIGTAAANLADGVVEEPGRVKKYGATIQAESRRLGETVERVLQLAGIAAGRASAARTTIPVADLVRDAVVASRHEIDLARAAVEVDIAAELMRLPADPSGVQRVVGDATALRSALQNLISNAIKYGGPTPWVRVSAKSMSHKVMRITVEDRGLGIAAEDRKHIFEPFYRGREAVARQIQGSGLGLHLVRRIVEAHGGSVSVQSEPGQGSTFTIDLPAVHNILVRRASAGEPIAERL